MTLLFLATPAARPAPNDFTLRAYRTIGMGRLVVRLVWWRARLELLLLLLIFRSTGLILRGLMVLLQLGAGLVDRFTRLFLPLLVVGPTDEGAAATMDNDPWRWLGLLFGV